MCYHIGHAQIDYFYFITKRQICKCKGKKKEVDRGGKSSQDRYWPQRNWVLCIRAPETGIERASTICVINMITGIIDNFIRATSVKNIV
jgi:hypothetical protein